MSAKGPPKQDPDLGPCTWCGEPVLQGTPREASRQPVHLECSIRSVMGGLNHQAGNCSCCGGDQPPDPPGLTRHEAAVVATALWRWRMTKTTG